MKVYLIEPIARLLLAALWWAGDALFDYIVTIEHAEAMRQRVQDWVARRHATLDAFEPKTERQKTWLDNRRNAVRATEAYMGFTPQVPLAERAERQIHGGGVHQP